MLEQGKFGEMGDDSKPFAQTPKVVAISTELLREFNLVSANNSKPRASDGKT